MTQPSFPHRLRALAIAMILASCVLATHRVSAQEASDVCESELTQAERLYGIGRFAEALKLLEGCYAERPGRVIQLRMRALEAKIHVALDNPARATVAIDALLELDPAYTPDPRDPPRYRQLVAELQQGESVRTVSSVSKVAESLREAPATVTVITAEQIARRGYLDLEEVLHDLPGIDISRTNGVYYANVYQRGFRSDLTERTLVLIDGVEENNLSAGAVYLSRQYPLSNIQQIEVIYGPASTMYGANAFAGVINIITKHPRDLVEARQDAGHGGNGIDLEAFAGSRSTEGGEITAVGSLGSLSWSLTGRYFGSDELDRSGFEDWDYDPAYFDNPTMPYSELLRLESSEDSLDFLAFLAENGLSNCDGLAGCPYRFVRDADGVIVSTELTEAGAELAASLDRAAYDLTLDGNPIGYSDSTENWLVTGRLQLPNLTFGFQTWRRDEGATGWYTDRAAPGGDNLHHWVPQQSWLYLDYQRELNSIWSLRLFARFKEHETRGNSTLTFLDSYDRGSRDLRSLVQGEGAAWSTRFFFESSNELRGEATLTYQPSKRFSLVTGLELRNSAVARDFILSPGPMPSQTGSTSVPSNEGSNRLNGRDFGFYTQASYRLEDNLKVVIAGRVDYNEVRDNLGFGTEFNPRAAVVYSPRDWVFKAIYSTAIQDASNIQKFGANQGIQVGNPELRPEEVENFELAANWQRDDAFFFDAAVYFSSYSGVAQLTSVACADLQESLEELCNVGQTTIAQFQNLGMLEIFGAQLSASYEAGERLSLWGNYTYTDPENINPLNSSGDPLLDAEGDEVRRQRVGDIASHQLNLGAHADLTSRLSANLRLNFVGSRPTGLGTTVPENPLSEIGSSLVAHLAVTYRDLFQGGSLQLVVNNLFDEEYYTPGIRGASQRLYAPQIPQNGRGAFLRFKASF
ncbi:MAG: TonB-dependent receptor [Acidobacteriota bacterium]